MAQLKIAIAGANGRMGRTLVQAVEANPNTILVGALDRAGSGVLGLDAGFALGIKTGVKVTDNADIALDDADILIDFTRPSASLPLIEKCAAKGIKMVIGTTGFDDAGKAAIAAAARVLNEGYDIEIIEAHHHHKVDAPSGTALRMGEVIANAVGRDLKSCAVYGREGHMGARDPKTIGFSTIRAGDIVGEHTALFATDGERVEITHKASSRMTFAAGAVRAAVWLQNHPTGLFDMQDVLGLKN